MGDTQFLETEQGRQLAYHKFSGRMPAVVFLGGLRSDMTGTKAVHLEAWARRSGREFLRFDYSGHGESSGEFTDGCIGDWHEDTVAAISALTEEKVVVVGSSMGGWQALLLAKRMPEKLAGIVTIAAAPDFTEDGYWEVWTEEERKTVMEEGEIALPSEYGDAMVITRKLIEDGRNHFVLREPLKIDLPVRMLQGTADMDVPTDVALRLLDHVEGDDIHLELIKDADHRFSTPECLDTITRAVEEVLINA
ncbi:alpha/beta hydrolase [Gymnodinialimonas hymeniacidonis]|uniref:alpha/beta hydrolase n=1 Tax=Gymnodinialimonas hymeniacidonis TaxID=3126508 RepID=UPI0034C5C977